MSVLDPIPQLFAYADRAAKKGLRLRMSFEYDFADRHEITVEAAGNGEFSTLFRLRERRVDLLYLLLAAELIQHGDPFSMDPKPVGRPVR